VNIIIDIFMESWRLLQEASIYMLFGILVAGLLRVFLNPGSVARHLGRGRFRSVFKAAILGIPIPLCSCGVLPAAASLKKQGANNGATTAFLISTPESGIDSIAMTYALLDPIMTVARPVVAFVTAAVAGISENLFSRQGEIAGHTPDLSCPIDGCCDGRNCPPDEHRNHHTFLEKVRAGMRYAFNELWSDIAAWFIVGLILAGLIGTLIPQDLMTRYLGGGIISMLIMLCVGIPLYICATASTPVAAALIISGVSPGAALVFLLVGPATNVTSLTILLKILGKRATVIYLIAISVAAVLFGLLLDSVYSHMGISAQAVAGQAAELIPYWARTGGAFILLALSAKPFYRLLRSWFSRKDDHEHGPSCVHAAESVFPMADSSQTDCDCGSPT